MQYTTYCCSHCLCVPVSVSFHTRATKSRQKNIDQAKVPTSAEKVHSATPVTPLKTKHTKTRRRSKVSAKLEIDSLLSALSKATEQSTTVPATSGPSALALPLLEEGRQQSALDADKTESFVHSKGDFPAPHSSSDSIQSAPALPLKTKHPKPPRRIPPEQPTVC